MSKQERIQRWEEAAARYSDGASENAALGRAVAELRDLLEGEEGQAARSLLFAYGADIFVYRDTQSLKGLLTKLEMTVLGFQQYSQGHHISVNKLLTWMRLDHGDRCRLRVYIEKMVNRIRQELDEIAANAPPPVDKP